MAGLVGLAPALALATLMLVEERLN